MRGNDLHIFNSFHPVIKRRILLNDRLDLGQLLLCESFELAGGGFCSPPIVRFQGDPIPILFAQVHLLMSGQILPWQAFVLRTVQDKCLWKKLLSMTKQFSSFGNKIQLSIPGGVGGEGWS